VSTVAEVLARLRAAGCTVAPAGGRLVVDRPDPATPEAAEALAVLRQHRDEVQAALADVGAHLAGRCCLGLRVWCEADRLHADYARGGRARLDRAAYLAAVLADGRAVLTPGGIVAGIGLQADWPTEDGGTLHRQQRGGGRHGG